MRQNAEVVSGAYAALDIDHTLLRGSTFDLTICAAIDRQVIPAIPRSPYDDRVTVHLRHLSSLIQGEPDTLFDSTLEALDPVFRAKLFRYTQPLLTAARAQGLDITLITQSPQQFAEAFAAAIGGADHILASQLVTESGRFTGEVRPLRDKWGTLVTRILRGSVRPPYVAAGDTIHDLEILSQALHPLAVGMGMGMVGEAHPLIHMYDLPIPIVNENHDGEIEQCRGQLWVGSSACSLEVITQDQLLRLAGLGDPTQNL